ncbi:MAG: carboxylating nicotinate-nucleotide diphosphorylase [Candidatus Omnitrophota bacterium]|nr:carboxylating nicotinate-nucleotide diphosphorylase [Candidatus Omnitrophota bacterium]
MNYLKKNIKNIIKQTLKEDIGKGDITTLTFIPKDKYVKAALKTEQDCVLCGIDIACEVFKTLSKETEFRPLFSDGQKMKLGPAGRIIAYISGKAQSILTAERTALNFLSLLSGIATKTRLYVDRVRPYKVKILDTRKTIPCLRELEKYAVRIGGGFNHRSKLDEMLLIKDNHLKVTGSYRKLKKVKGSDKDYKMEAEVKNLKEFKEALELKPDIIMLDNMGIKEIKRAVKIRNCLSSNAQHLRPKLEVSGGVSLKNVKKIASCGVDMISIGSLTHSVNSINMSLEIL